MRRNAKNTLLVVWSKMSDSLRAAAWGFLLMWGMILSGCSLVLLFVAGLGHVPVWHAAVAAFAAMLSLTLSHIASE